MGKENVVQNSIEYYSAIKKMNTCFHNTPTQLEITMLTKISQLQKYKYVSPVQYKKQTKKTVYIR